ncbi:DNA polymerase [Acidiphilium acidophilum]|uniref:DNA polymerase n=1 Tax=Acidiphilium acidophilum TaxID=76588 RepID=UPI002E8E6655|nr:DNA polymerase [Acidiphilium acidophilum]
MGFLQDMLSATALPAGPTTAEPEPVTVTDSPVVPVLPGTSVIGRLLSSAPRSVPPAAPATQAKVAPVEPEPVTVTDTPMAPVLPGTSVIGRLLSSAPRSVPPAAPATQAKVAPASPAAPAAAPATTPTPAAPPSPYRSPYRITDRFAGSSDLPTLIERLEAATEISLDLETTALTPWAAPSPSGKALTIGNDLTISRYCRANSCSIDARPRARILAVETDSGLMCAIDLDTLIPDEIDALITALARPDVTWVGHNLGFDLQWIFHLSPGARPGRIIDTMLLTTARRPQTETDIIHRIADALPVGQGIESDLRAEIDRRAAGKAKRGDEADGGLGLNLLSMHLLGEKLEKSYQKPHNWMPGTLSDGHLTYCLSDIHQPRLLARILLGLPQNAPMSAVLAAVDQHPGGKAYKIFETAVPRLVQMQHNGLRIDRTAVEAFKIEKRAAAEAASVELFAAAPGLTRYKAALFSGGLTADLKSGVAAELERITGKPCPQTAAGEPELGAAGLALAYPGQPAVVALAALRGAMKEAAMAAEYAAAADSDGRLHPLTSIKTVTGRTASQEPNLQNMPRGQGFRALFRARPGFKVLATDFSAIEMVVAAALAERNYAEFLCNNLKIERWILKGSPVLQQVLAAIRSGQPAMPLIPPGWPLAEPQFGADVGFYAPYYASRYAVVLARLQSAGCRFRQDTLLSDIEKMALPTAFRTGIDPHLLTALGTEIRAARFDAGGRSALEYLTRLSQDERGGLKKTLAEPRKKAKPLNFGLLYGMSADGLWRLGVTSYGLTWTIEEATEARSAWFEMYPEIELWHLLIKNSHSTKKTVIKYGKIVEPTEGGRIFTSRTLSSRPVIGSAMREAANYSDQGTAAEIALDSIVRLPEWLAERFVNFVHDELVFEVETDRTEQAKVEIESAMLGAAKDVLGRYRVPCGVETAIGDHWIH